MKIFRKMLNMFKIRQKYHHFTWRCKYVSLLLAIKIHHKTFLYDTQKFDVLDSDNRGSTINLEIIFSFPLQLWLRECATMVRYAYLASLVSLSTVELKCWTQKPARTLTLEVHDRKEGSREPSAGRDSRFNNPCSKIIAPIKTILAHTV
jgi:hypothetical protein